MSVEFSCHACGRDLKANDRSIGRRARCPECGTLLIIPDPAEALEELEEEAAEEEEQKIDEPGEPPPAAQQASAIREPPPVIAPPRGAASPPRPAAPPTRLTRPASPAKATTSAGRGGPKETPLLPRHRPHPEDLIDMTAMVDIVFFLLIFFLVTSLQSLESVMNMPTPQAAEGGVSTGRSVADLENDPNYITVRIEDDDSIWVEDTQVFNDQELSLKLRAARKESEGPRSLLVIGDADASHGAAVRVFDAGAGAGVTGISLVVQEKSEASR